MEIQQEIILLDDITKILDKEYISNTVGWLNHGDPIVIFTNNQINNWVYVHNTTNEIIDFQFDKVFCYGLHGLGTIYCYSFYLNNQYVDISNSDIFSDTILNLKVLIQRLKTENYKLRLKAWENFENNIL